MCEYLVDDRLVLDRAVRRFGNHTSVAAAEPTIVDINACAARLKLA